MIVVTGARGFIGSNLVHRLNTLNISNLILVDELEKKEKDSNLKNTKYKILLDRSLLFDWLKTHSNKISFFFHLGARADTTEQDINTFLQLNLNYSKEVFGFCTKQQIPLVYASSAATYGNGDCGYSDEIEINQLEALNPYGESKHHFDLWVNNQENQPPFWAGLKFFNVYGERESHKRRMASVIFHAFEQIQKTDAMKLFQSHKEGIANGEQKRDFIYVQDVIDVCCFFYKNQVHSGLYNVGTGKARSFNDLVSAVFRALNKKERINYIPTPIDIRESYQYFTQAEMNKLKNIGFNQNFTSLEDGVKKYVQEYLLKN